MKKVIKIKDKSYSFQLTDPVFSTALFVIVNISFEKMGIKVKKKFPDFELLEKYKDSNGLFFSHYDGKTNLHYPILWVRKFDWCIKSQEVFVHELAHFIFDELCKKNMPSSENNEGFCYLFGYYFGECWKKLKRFYVL